MPKFDSAARKYMNQVPSTLDVEYKEDARLMVVVLDDCMGDHSDTNSEMSGKAVRKIGHDLEVV